MVDMYFIGGNKVLHHQKFSYLMYCTISCAGKYVNGTTMVVDGGLWLSHPRHVPKDEVKALSRIVEKKVRTSGVGVPSSKL
jgi:hypothetical protein